MSSFLDRKDGIFLPAQRYSFTNITDSPFTSRWGGIPVVVGAHQSIEVSDSTPFFGLGNGEALAIKFTKELVDQIFAGQAKMVQNAGDETHKPGDVVYNRPAIGMMAGVPAQRKIYEDQILKKLDVDEEDGSVKSLKQALVQQLAVDSSRQEGVMVEPEKGFSEIPKGGFAEEVKKVGSPAKVKQVDAA